jgi:hypothetical protein
VQHGRLSELVHISIQLYLQQSPGLISSRGDALLALSMRGMPLREDAIRNGLIRKSALSFGGTTTMLQVFDAGLQAHSGLRIAPIVR